MKFLDSLKTYDKDNIPAATIKKIRDKYVPMASFNAKEVSKVSSGTFSLLTSSTVTFGAADWLLTGNVIFENSISL